MPDILRNDRRIGRTLPDAYSELMLPVCGGHALWSPRKVANGGGALGDVGYIEDGAFEKLFNVYESPPLGLPCLPRPVTGITLDEDFNMMEMKSSRRTTIDLHVSGSNDVASLPLVISPSTIEPRISLHDEKFAYLIPPRPVRKDHVNLNVRDELRDWLTVHYHNPMLRHGSIIITKVVRSSGWLGGVANGRKTEASITGWLGLPGLGRLNFGASRAYEVTQLASIHGPDNWTKNGSNYTLIVGFVMARGRLGRFLSRQKVKAATASAAQSEPSSQVGLVQAGMSADSQLPTPAVGDLETEPLDDLETHSETEHDTSSSESSEDGDPTLLALLLDHVLLTNADIDVAVSDSSIIADFITAHGTVPSPSEITAVFATRLVSTKHDGNPVVEKVAFVDSLQPRKMTRERRRIQMEPGTIPRDRGSDRLRDDELANDLHAFQPPSGGTHAFSSLGGLEGYPGDETYPSSSPRRSYTSFPDHHLDQSHHPLTNPSHLHDQGMHSHYVTPLSIPDSRISPDPSSALVHAHSYSAPYRDSMSHSFASTQDLTATVIVDFDCKVASGGYDVYKGRLTRDVDGHSGEVAVKVTRFTIANRPEDVMKGIKQGLEIWQQHRHPYILPLIGVYLHRDGPCVVSPWCDRGTLLQYIKSARAGHEPELDSPVTDCDFDLLRLHCLEIKLLSEVAAGLAYLHTYNLVHGDIKASNILVKGGVAQLGGFEISVIEAELTGSTSSLLGTLRWFAPEAFEEHAHRTQEADVWAFGCVILEVRTLLVPYYGINDPGVPLAIRKHRPYELPKDIHPSLWSMAEACWARSPKARIVSPTLASRMKTTLKYVTVLRKALGVLPNVQSLDLGYRNSESKPSPRFSLGSVLSKILSKKDDVKSLDLTLMVATARNALRALESKQCPADALRPTIRLIAVTNPRLAEQLLLTLPPPGSLGPPLRGHTDGVQSVAFLSDGLRLVSGSSDKTLRVWDVQTGQTVLGPVKRHTSVVSCVAAHGSRFASCSHDGTFRVYNTANDRPLLGPITAHRGADLRWIAYSRDGTRIATAGDDRAAIWDANTGTQLREMVGHTNFVSCVAFSEDGTRLVSCSLDQTVRIWDVVSGQCIGEPLTGHTDWVQSVCFSRDDKRIFSGSRDRLIRIWDAETRTLVVEPLQTDGAVLCMALSPDGKRLVSGSDSNKIAMWDAESGTAIPTPIRGHKDWVWSVVFSPDGRKIASASKDMTIGLWDASDDWKQYDVDDEGFEEDDDWPTGSSS